MRPWRRGGLPGATIGAAIAAVLLLVVTAGCAGTSAAAPPTGPHKLPVVASTNVWGDIAAQLGGARVDVRSLIYDPSQDPHTYQPTGRDELAVSRAAVVVDNGGGYDDVVTAMLQAVHAEAAVVTAVDAARAARPTPPVTDNEHVWFDLSAVSAVAGRIADALTRADPDGRSEFASNLATFRRTLEPLDAAVERIRAQHAGAPVAITEPLPLYLIEAAGLDNVTPAAFSDAVEEGIDVTPSQLADTVALFGDRKVEALLYNEQSTGSQTDQVLAAATKNDVPVVPVTELLPAGVHYQQWMLGTIDALAAALDRAEPR